MDGGLGGTGQDGGNGGATPNGKTCSVPQAGLQEKCVNPQCNPWPYRAQATTPFYNLGTVPEKGGNGGLGGEGGLGGLGGLAKITKLDDNLPDKFVVTINYVGNSGPIGKRGKGGIGGIGGCQYKCTRTFFWDSWRCCVTNCLVTCCDYGTCESSVWRNDLVNTCVQSSGQNGITPSSKNAIGRQLNEIPIISIENVLLNYKIEPIEKDSSDFYRAFQNYLDMKKQI